MDRVASFSFPGFPRPFQDYQAVRANLLSFFRILSAFRKYQFYTKFHRFDRFWIFVFRNFFVIAKILVKMKNNGTKLDVSSFYVIIKYVINFVTKETGVTRY